MKANRRSAHLKRLVIRRGNVKPLGERPGGRRGATHPDAVGVPDQLVDVRGVSAQLGRIVLQDDAFAGAAVQAEGGLSSCGT